MQQGLPLRSFLPFLPMSQAQRDPESSVNDGALAERGSVALVWSDWLASGSIEPTEVTRGALHPNPRMAPRRVTVMVKERPMCA